MITQELSKNVDDMMEEGSILMQNAFNRACYFAQERFYEGMQTMSLFGNLVRQMEPQKADNDDRLPRFGDPADSINYEQSSETYIPRKMRKYM